MANVVLFPENAFTVRVAVVTSEKPNTLSKTFGYQEGQLTKTGGGQIYQGRVEVRQVSDVDDLKKLLLSLEQNQALCNSLPSLDEAVILTKEAFNKAGQPENAITRSADHFSFAKGLPGVLTLDCC